MTTTNPTATHRYKMGHHPAQVSLWDQLYKHGRIIGHNTAMPTCLFVSLHDTVYSMYQGVACNHGPENTFRADVTSGKSRATLTA